MSIIVLNDVQMQHKILDNFIYNLYSMYCIQVIEMTGVISCICQRDRVVPDRH